MSIDKNKLKDALTKVLTGVFSRFKQEMSGENEETLDRVVRQHRASVARRSWKTSQKWCKWNDEGPILMPDFTRLYYRKGKTEIVIQEFAPQTRLMRFKGSLAKRDSSTDYLSGDDNGTTFQYSLSLPYTVFIFKFVDGMFSAVRCAFSDRPLKRLEERPLRPYLSNIDSQLLVCLGRDMDRSELIKDNIAQQCAFILSSFWQTVYSDEWSQHFWASKSHFQDSDSRLATLEAWQDASIDNPLFVVEDVAWLQHTEETFGDIVVRMFEDDATNLSLHEELYEELADNFLAEVKKTFDANFDSTKEKVLGDTVDQLINELEI